MTLVQTVKSMTALSARLAVSTTVTIGHGLVGLGVRAGPAPAVGGTMPGDGTPAATG